MRNLNLGLLNLAIKLCLFWVLPFCNWLLLQQVDRYYKNGQMDTVSVTISVTMEEEVGLECVNFINCTGSNFITNWTDNNCVYKGGVTHNLRYLALSCTGIVAIVGIIANILILSSFLYVVTCKTRIKRKFLRVEFSYMQEPIFLLVCHLSVCDLIYCSFGVPMIW